MFKVLILVLFTSIHIVLNKDGLSTGEHIFEKKVLTNIFLQDIIFLTKGIFCILLCGGA